MAAEEYWALRLDKGFDAFSAERTDSKFELISQRSEQRPGTTLEHMECLLQYNKNPVPPSFQHMLGARRPPAPGAAAHASRASASHFLLAGGQQFAFKYQSSWRAGGRHGGPARPEGGAADGASQ